jgi:hypothetical protein
MSQTDAADSAAPNMTDSTAQQACGHRALKGLEPRPGHAACHHAGNQSVFGNCHERSIQSVPLRVGREPSCHQQPDMIGKGHLTNEFATQVPAADHDYIGVTGRYRRFGWILPADLQR